MKKTIKLLLVSLLLICLCACKKDKNVVKNAIADLVEKGYEPVQTTFFDNKWYGLFEKDGNYKDAYKVELVMDQKTSDQLFELDRFDEKQQKEYIEIIESLSDCKVSSMNDLLKNETELNKYVGKTIKDLEDAGYERSGYIYSDDGCTFFGDGPIFSVNIKTDEIITDVTIDNYSENDIRALTIKGIEVSGFSYKIFD